MKETFIKIHPSDSVAVATQEAAAGELTSDKLFEEDRRCYCAGWRECCLFHAHYRKE